MKTILAAYFVVLALTEASPWYHKYRKSYYINFYLILIIKNVFTPFLFLYTASLKPYSLSLSFLLLQYSNKKALDCFSIYIIFKLNILWVGFKVNNRLQLAPEDLDSTIVYHNVCKLTFIKIYKNIFLTFSS